MVVNVVVERVVKTVAGAGAAIALCAGLLGCEGRESSQAPDESAGRSVVEKAAGIESIEGSAGAVAPVETEAPGGDSSGAAVVERKQVPLNLTLPADSGGASVGEDVSAGESALLPDMFGEAKRARRTTVKGGLILDEEQAPEKRLPGVDGAQVDVEIRIN